MQVLKLVDGVVTNIELWDELPESVDGITYMEAINEVHIGWELVDGVFQSNDYDENVHFGHAIKIAVDGTVVERIPDMPADYSAGPAI